MRRPTSFDIEFRMPNGGVFRIGSYGGADPLAKAVRTYRRIRLRVLAGADLLEELEREGLVVPVHPRVPYAEVIG